MRILFVSYTDPSGQGGFEKQARGLFATLSKSGHQIACLCISSPDQANHIESKLTNLEIFNLGIYIIKYQEKAYSLTAKTLFWFSKNPSKFLASQNPELQFEFQTKVHAICKDLQIDIVHCLGIRTSYFLPQTLTYPIVLDLVDCISLYKKRSIKYYLLNNFRKAFNAYFDFWKTRKIEKDILSVYKDYPIAVVSSHDAKFLKDIYPPAIVKTVCHPVAIGSFNDTLGISNSKMTKTLVFYGFMNTIFNIDAMFFLIKEIMPKVLKVFPDVNLKITGFYLPNKIYEIAKDNSWVSIIDHQDNIVEFISQATLTCWPFRYGSGLKNKIIESMLLGKPVVTTNVGGEALTEEQKQGILIADSADGLAEKIIYLLKNPDECSKLGDINREIALTQFTWEKKAQDYIALYQLAQENFKNKQLKV